METTKKQNITTSTPFIVHDATTATTTYCNSAEAAQAVYDIEASLSGASVSPGVSLFTFPVTGKSVRTVQGPDGEPWFVARDIAVALGYADPADAIQRHCKKVNNSNMGVSPSVPSPKIIPESDVYRLVMRSNLPTAEAFQDWVVEEVLPTLRKHGYYGTPPTPTHALSEDQIILEAMRVLQARTDALQTQLTEAHTELAETRAELTTAQPKAAFFDEYMECDGLLTLTQAAQQFGLSGRRLGAFLREKPHKWLTHTMFDSNMPIQAVLDRGLMVTKARTNSRTGFPCMQSYFTPKGMHMLARLLDDFMEHNKLK